MKELLTTAVSCAVVVDVDVMMSMMMMVVMMMVVVVVVVVARAIIMSTLFILLMSCLCSRLWLIQHTLQSTQRVTILLTSSDM